MGYDGSGQIVTITEMHRLLTDYAMAFNRRHHRHGQLFKNRYKSIDCEQTIGEEAHQQGDVFPAVPERRQGDRI